jgi:DNA-directed RNA polymerase subunit RPC12/RpoP
MTVGIVECQHCGATADLEEISDNEDVCLECGTEIVPIARVLEDDEAEDETEQDTLESERVEA